MLDQSRESEKQILSLKKDIEHLQYIITTVEKESEFIKKHFTTKNSERLDEIKTIHKRIDQHLQTDLDFHENVRKKISDRFQIFDDRIRQLDRWKWATWGALIVIGALCGYYVPFTLPFK
jgi:DNA anti-recombination protein RmuC